MKNIALFTFILLFCTQTIFGQTCPFDEPSMPVMNLQAINVTAVNAVVNFSTSGFYTIIVAKEGSPVSVTPSDCTIPRSILIYKSSSGQSTPDLGVYPFGQGMNLGNGNFIVYAGTTPLYPIGGFAPNKTYHIQAFAANLVTNTSGQSFFDLRIANAPTAQFLTQDCTLPLAPTQASTNVQFANSVGSSITVSWTKGNGRKRIVIARKGTPPTYIPASNSHVIQPDYSTANPINYENAANTLTGDKIVYVGTENSFVLEGLFPSTSYAFSVFEYNDGCSTVYLTSNFPTGTYQSPPPRCPAVPPSLAPSNITFTNTSNKFMTVNWTKGNGDASLVAMREGFPVVFTPQNCSPLSQYFAGQVLPDGTKFVAITSTNSQLIQGLTAGKTYYFAVWDFKYNRTDPLAPKYDFLLSPFATASTQTTSCVLPAPTVQASAHSSQAGSNYFDLAWTRGNGSKRIVLMAEQNGHQDAQGFSLPPNESTPLPSLETSLTNPISYTGAMEWQPFWKYVHNGTGNTIRVTDVDISKSYWLVIIEYNEGCNMATYLQGPIIWSTCFRFVTISSTGKNCAGDLRLQATQHPYYTYQWTKDGVDIPGATAYQYTVPLTGSYRVRIVNATQGCSITSDPLQVSFSILPTPSINGSSTVCTDFTSTYGYTTQTGMQDYDWNPDGGTVVSGQGTPSAIVRWNQSGARTLSVSYKTVEGCGPVTATLNVQVNKKPNVLNGDITICSGSYTAISLTSDVSGSTFSWGILNPTNISGAQSGSGNTINQRLTLVDVTLSGSVEYSVSAASNNCSGTKVIKVIVNPIPSLNINPPTHSPICSGGTASAIFSSNLSGAVFNWNAQPNSVGAQSGNGNTLSQVLTNAGISSAIATYEIRASLNGCESPVAVYPVTVKPLARVTATDKTICSGQSTSIPLTSNISGTTFSWIPKNPNGVSGASSGNGSTISQVLTTTSTSVGTVTYTITTTPPTGGCAGPPVDVTVTVNPKPSITQTGSQLQSTICSNTSVGFAPNADIPGTTFTWTSTLVSGTVSGRSSSGSGNINDILSTTGTTIARVDYVITPQLNGCSGTAKTLQVSIKPNLSASISGNANICSGSSVTLTANPSGYTYAWSNGATTRSITVSSTGTYAVTVSHVNYCSSTASKVIGSGTTPPAPTINVMNNYLSCTGSGGSAQLVSSQADAYSWSNGGTSQMTTIFATGTYTVTITKNGCTKSTSKYVTCPGGGSMAMAAGSMAEVESTTQDAIPEKGNETARGVEEINYASGEILLLYPNPVDDELIVQLATPSETATPFRLINQFGQNLVESKIPAKHQSTSIHTKDLPEGMYLLEVMYGQGRVIKKVMIMH